MSQRRHRVQSSSLLLSSAHAVHRHENQSIEIKCSVIFSSPVVSCRYRAPTSRPCPTCSVTARTTSQNRDASGISSYCPCAGITCFKADRAGFSAAS